LSVQIHTYIKHDDISARVGADALVRPASATKSSLYQALVINWKSKSPPCREDATRTGHPGPWLRVPAIPFPGAETAIASTIASSTAQRSSASKQRYPEARQGLLRLFNDLHQDSTTYADSPRNHPTFAELFFLICALSNYPRAPVRARRCNIGAIPPPGDRAHN